MRRFVGIFILFVGVALAVVVGQRMSTDAMAVAVGVVFGVAASIPTSLLVIAATRHQNRDNSQRYTDRPQQPTIYVVQPGQVPWVQPPQNQSTPEPQAQWRAPDFSAVVDADYHVIE